MLVLSLPTQGATARMRIWRALKALGAAALRDGAYLLPERADHRQALQALADECVREGGSAWMLGAAALGEDDARLYPAMFDRAQDYAALAQAWQAAAATLAAQRPAELTRLQRRLRRDYDTLRAIDFFPGDAAAEAELAWADLDGRIERLLTPGEPQPAGDRAPPRLDSTQYQGRLWATRRRMWVDRVASAWLIRRFIDPQARFLWLDSPADCPPQALGFDFDGAAFSHVGRRVTFETLLASFGLEGDAALMRIAALVHYMDVGLAAGGAPVPEASGFEALLAGARERLQGDDALLAEAGTMLDSLHAHFQRGEG